MQLSEYIRMSLSEIRRNLVRSVLTILGIVIGVCAMIMVLSVGDAGQESVYNELEKFGINRLFIYPNENVDKDILKRSDIEYLSEHVSRIDEISPQSFATAKITYNGKSETTEIIGTTEVLKDVENKVMAEGRFINENDVEYARNSIVLSDDIKETLFGNASALGETVEMNGKKLKVVGVEQNTKPLYTSITSAKSYISISAYEEIFQTASVGEISITVASSSDMDSVAQRSVDLLLDKYGSNSIKTMNLAEEAKNAENILTTFKLVIGAIALISLFVGGIGIMNIMLVTVRERTKEIGIRKALGAKNSVILKQFLMESILYALIGSVSGVAMGVLLSVLAEKAIGLSVQISLFSIGASVVFSAIIGILFGIIPAFKAARLDPSQSLRHS